MKLVIRRAKLEDAATVRGLMTRACVRQDGVEENIASFLLVEDEGEAVGTVGLEILEERYGVMRSLILQPGAWNAEVAMELLRLFCTFAETQGIQRLYLLTTSTASDLFIHMGFSTTTFEELPPAVAQSQHFLSYPVEQVIPMVRISSSTSYPHPHVDSVGN